MKERASGKSSLLEARLEAVEERLLEPGLEDPRLLPDEGLLREAAESGRHHGLLVGLRDPGHTGHTTAHRPHLVGGDVVGDAVARDEVRVHPGDPGRRAAAAGARDIPALASRAVGLDVHDPGLRHTHRLGVVGVRGVGVDHVGSRHPGTGQVGRLLVPRGGLHAGRHARVGQARRQHRPRRRSSHQGGLPLVVAPHEGGTVRVVPHGVLHTIPETAGPVAGAGIEVGTEAEPAEHGRVRHDGAGGENRSALGRDAPAEQVGSEAGSETGDDEATTNIHDLDPFSSSQGRG